MYRNKFVASIAVAGHTLREIDGQVYLPFGTEYQIYLKNTHNQEVLVDVEVDGKSILEGKRLILKAYESHTMSTHMDGKGMHYNLKFIEKTAAISEHRGDKVEDGLVRVTYQFVKPPVIDINKIKYGYKVPDDQVTWYSKSPTYRSFASNGRGSSMGLAQNSFTSDTLIGSVNTAIDNAPVHAFLSNCSDDYSVKCSYNASYETLGNISVAAASVNTAGITTKGEKREDVHYNDVAFDKPLEPADSIVLKLVGKKDKNIELENGSSKVVMGKIVTSPVYNRQDVNCPICNHRNASSNRYCSDCGTNLM